MKSVVFCSVVLLLGGCATFPPTSTAWVACDGIRCNDLWSRSQVWLAVNSAYRIQIANENIIQTYGPTEGTGAIAYTVTKERASGDKTRIVIRGHCFPTVYGCMYDPSQQTNALFNELMKP